MSMATDFDDALRTLGSSRVVDALLAAQDTIPPAPPYDSYGEADEPAAFETIDWIALADTPIPEREWTLPGLIPHGEVTLFTGPGGCGKSLAAQQLATCVAAHVPFLGMRARWGTSIYITAEDDVRELRFRQSKINEALRVDIRRFADRLHVISLRGEEANELCVFDADGRIRRTPTFGKLLATIEHTGATCVVLDNVAHLFTGNENDRGQVTQFANMLNALALRGVTVILVAHPNKAGDSYSGSTAWLNAVRSHITIDYQKSGDDGVVVDPDARTITAGKANYARTGESVSLRWHDWAFVADSEISDDFRDRLAVSAGASADNITFLQCLGERNRQERPVSESPASRTYAPRVFAQMAASKGIGKARLQAAMERLFAVSAIERGFVYRNSAEGKDCFGLRQISADVPADHPLTPSADLPMTTRRPPLAHTLVLRTNPAGADSGPPAEFEESDDDEGMPW